jgi:methylenetetrahydrofolate reductase (NADPH)
MHIQDVFREHATTFSFEFFPPKTDAAAQELFANIARLQELQPSFVSVTYGAGGSTRELTHDLVVRIHRETSLTAVSHLTCVCHTREELGAILDRYAASGIENILALSGDLPRNLPNYDRSQDAFRYAKDLVSFVKSWPNAPGPCGFGIGVAGFPEGHPATPNRLRELDFLKEKVDAGADYICTQLFFDNRDFYDFRERCDLAGIRVPIIAGIMPVTSKQGMQTMAGLALGARFPAGLLRMISRCSNDQAVARAGIHWATEQCRELLHNHVRGIHFYTLNKSDATRQIFDNLGVKDAAALRSPSSASAPYRRPAQPTSQCRGQYPDPGIVWTVRGSPVWRWMMSGIHKVGRALGLMGVCLVMAISQGARAEVPFAKRTFTYKTAGHSRIQADVYRPEDKTIRPVLVWIHGGALIVGSRHGIPQDFHQLCRTQGYVLISIDYRLAPEVKLPEIIDDVKDAFRWIRTKGPDLFQGDPDKLVVAGGSAGGYLTMMTGICIQPRPRALVAYWGYGDVDGPWYTEPSEFYRTSGPLISREEAYKAVGTQVLTGAEGDAGQARGKFYRYLRQNGLWTKTVSGFDARAERSKLDPYCPVRNIRSDYPPILMIHGTIDTDVPYEESAAMAKELARQKLPHELITVPGAGHGLSGGDKKLVAAAHERALQFIREHLK